MRGYIVINPSSGLCIKKVFNSISDAETAKKTMSEVNKHTDYEIIDYVGCKNAFDRRRSPKALWNQYSLPRLS